MWGVYVSTGVGECLSVYVCILARKQRSLADRDKVTSAAQLHTHPTQSTPGHSHVFASQRVFYFYTHMANSYMLFVSLTPVMRTFTHLHQRPH